MKCPHGVEQAAGFDGSLVQCIACEYEDWKRRFEASRLPHLDLDMPEALPNEGASAADGGPEISESDRQEKKK
jgi:hypothetical protein